MLKVGCGMPGSNQGPDSGVMGSGAAASEEVENMPEQCAMVTKAYEDLLER